ncbi:PLP-dependent aminotransferase family protein [Acidaminobacter sp. JC074]|uniref:MocR-like pyridoxine biosynthesis transcription factor PdxR n=1 Tax=Acidaminobacter sp. JC074 TaxID=2530199 RepID=UPI001F0DE091|nr:PLP-dependent aminotransferase family protein [Acidaminobacter sp. JC074]
MLNREPSDLAYGNHSGHVKLRKTLSEYLYRTRGIVCHEDQIIITSGVVPGLFLLIQYFSRLSGSIIVEDPVNNVVRDMLRINGVKTIHHPVDNQGIDPTTLPMDSEISSILLTPSHQYPMGGSLSISRRIQLVNYARERNCYIIEDDYDSDFRYTNSPVESIHELDPERVIYISSFSKNFIPSLRLGYMVLPTSLVSNIHYSKRFVNIHSPTFEQLAMEKFISNGYLEQYLNKMKKKYIKRQHVLIKCLKKSFGKQVEIIGGETGLHLVVCFKGVRFTSKLIEKIKGRGVYIVPVSQYSVFPENHKSQLILGYGNLDENQISEGISIIKSVLKSS